MNQGLSTFLVRYDGQLVLSDDFVPTYIGGKNRPIHLSVTSSFEDLKRKIVRCLKHDVRQFTANIVCRFPISAGFIATEINDNESCDVILQLAQREPIVLYVEVTPNAGNDVIEANIESQQNTNVSTVDRTQPSCVEPDNRILADYNRNRNVSHFRADYPSTSQPPFIDNLDLDQNIHQIDEGYETMCSESSGESSGSEGLLETENIADIGGDSLAGHDLLQTQSLLNPERVDHMIVNNDYVLECLTTHEWDANANVDEPVQNVIPCLDGYIPDNLEENLCFSSKLDLQYALCGWSIRNNVEYKIVYSNKSRYTIICVHSEHPERPCQWRLHASSRKRLADAWRIFSIPAPHTCTHLILLGGHKQCTSRYISYFILPSIRQ